MKPSPLSLVRKIQAAAFASFDAQWDQIVGYLKNIHAWVVTESDLVAEFSKVELCQFNFVFYLAYHP